MQRYYLNGVTEGQRTETENRKQKTENRKERYRVQLAMLGPLFNDAMLQSLSLSCTLFTVTHPPTPTRSMPGPGRRLY